MSEFKKVFGHDKLTIREVSMAIAAFEDPLVTPNSRFDKWLKGDKKVLKPSADTLSQAVDTMGRIQLGARFLGSGKRPDRDFPENPDGRPAQAHTAHPAAVERHDQAARAV